jgi:transketolase
MTVLAPADPAQARAVVRATAERPGPCYLRIGKGNNPEVPGLGGRFAFERPEVVREGRHLLFVACGGIVHEALEAARALEAQGISAAVAVLAHLPFAPGPEVMGLLGRFTAVVSVEEGYSAGGLGSLLAEAIAQGGLRCRLRIRGVDHAFAGVAGGESYMRARSGLDAGALAAAARDLLGR